MSYFVLNIARYIIIALIFLFLLFQVIKYKKIKYSPFLYAIFLGLIIDIFWLEAYGNQYYYELWGSRRNKFSIYPLNFLILLPCLFSSFLIYLVLGYKNYKTLLKVLFKGFLFFMLLWLLFFGSSFFIHFVFFFPITFFVFHIHEKIYLLSKVQ